MQNKEYEFMNWPRIEAVVYAEEQSPRDVMGPRITKEGVLLQGFFPDAVSAKVTIGEAEYDMVCQDKAGYFALLIPMRQIPHYTYTVVWEDHTEQFADAYAFPCQLTEAEEKAFLAGTWYEAYTKLGSHPMEINGVKGTLFAVWAPNAKRVSVVGDFDRWDGRRLPMHRMPMTGIYELFVPGVEAGALYKYEMLLKGNVLQLKADPYARRAEKPMGDASVAAPSENFSWTDQAFMERRAGTSSFNVPCAIYETTLACWKNYEDLIAFLKEEKYTHVELHPIMEYMDDVLDGYPSSSLYAVSNRYGEGADVKKLINDLHNEGIGVILDWNAAQFPGSEAGLALFDGTPLYEPADPSAAVHPMWSTMLYNYGSPMVTDYLLSNACYWAEVYHIDGLRMDDVDAMLYLDYGKQPGEYTPNLYGTNENLEAVEFLKHFNSIMHKRYPGFLTIAQEDGLWPCLTSSVEDDCIGFDYKWSGGWTADLLNYLCVDPILRSNYHDQLTLSMLYAYSEHYILTLGSRDVGNYDSFLNKMWGDDQQKAAQVRAAVAYMYLHPGCKMTSPDIDIPPELGRMIKALNEMYRAYPALSVLDDAYEGFEWVQLMKYEENVLTFLRKSEKPEETLLVICNFSAVSRPAYQTGVPFYGKYKEIFNSDSAVFGGSGYVNPRAKTAVEKECDERDCSIKMNIPPLSVCVFSCTPAERPVKKTAEKTGKTGAGKTATGKTGAGKTAAGKASTEKTSKALTAEAKKAETAKPAKTSTAEAKKAETAKSAKTSTAEAKKAETAKSAKPSTANTVKTVAAKAAKTAAAKAANTPVAKAAKTAASKAANTPVAKAAIATAAKVTKGAAAKE